MTSSPHMLLDLSDKIAQRELMLAMYRSVLSRRGATYCSGPITGGKRALLWHKHNSRINDEFDSLPEQMRQDFLEKVVRENANDLRTLSASLRSTTTAHVIDPSALPPLRGWQQDDWRQFWCQVIGTFATSVVVTSGWEFSKGSRKEVDFAFSIGIPVILRDGSSLCATTAENCIALAISEMKSDGFVVGDYKREFSYLFHKS